MLSQHSNYDAGNRDLLTLVLALQRLRHWLEGSEQPFFVWMVLKKFSTQLAGSTPARLPWLNSCSTVVSLSSIELIPATSNPTQIFNI